MPQLSPEDKSQANKGKSGVRFLSKLYDGTTPPGNKGRFCQDGGTMTGSEEDRLRAQYTEIATLAGQLAHEIKNPLSTITMNVELLAEDFAQPQNQRERRALERIQRVQRECVRLQQLLDDFLGFARAMPQHLEVYPLDRFLEEVLEFFRPQAQKHQVEVVQLFDSDLPPVKIDRQYFRAALLNLLINALQAMPQGGRLEVRTRRDGPAVAVDLIDTGQGMDSQTLARIFEPFFSTKPGGTGLGLPTARKIIEALGGTISVQSEPGRGTQFTIRLPAAGAQT